MLLNGVWVALLLGLVCTRFRDTPPMVASVMQLVFFITPIIWHPSLLAGRQRVIDFNPLYHFIELVRVLAGVYEPTSASVSVEGSVIPLLDIGLGIDYESTGFENIVLRLAFGISTSVAPEILLLDEFFGVGHSAFLEKAERRLNELVSKAGILVFASHSQELIRRLCNRAIWIDKGVVCMVGDPDTVLKQYAEAQAKPG